MYFWFKNIGCTFQAVYYLKMTNARIRQREQEAIDFSEECLKRERNSNLVNNIEFPSPPTKKRKMQ